MKITNPHSIGYLFGDIELKPGLNELAEVPAELVRSMQNAGMRVEVVSEPKSAVKAQPSETPATVAPQQPLVGASRSAPPPKAPAKPEGGHGAP